MKQWDDRIAIKARQLSIVEESEAVVVGSPVLSEQEQIEIGSLVSRVLRLLASMPERLSMNYKDYAIKQLRMSENAANIVTCSNECLSEEIFSRADIVRHKGKWKLLEMNVGSSVGGIFFPSLPRLSGVSQKYDVLKSWGEIIYKNYCHDGGHLAIIEDSSIMNKLRPEFELLASELTSSFGLKCSVMCEDDVWIENERLKSRFGEIDFIYRFFKEQNVISNKKKYHDLMKAISSGVVFLPMGFSSQLISNKNAMALLHKFVNTSIFSDDEKELIKDFIPYTCELTNDNIKTLIKEPGKWIIKPTDGACGIGVIYGGEVHFDEWVRHLYDIVNKEDVSYVAQRYCEAEHSSVILNDKEKGNFTELARIVWGIYVYGERYIGTLVRAKTRKDTVIVNHATGASIGPLSYSE